MAVEQKPDVVIPPIPKDAPTRQLAPWPQIDKYPVVIGQNLTGNHLSAQFRLGTQGWRYGYVDVINELLEHDPHTRGVVRQRVLAVAGARVDVRPPKLPKKHKDTDLSQQIAEDFAYDFEAIPELSQALGQLNWGVVYGVSACEFDWNLDPEIGWEPIGMRFVHSRRLNYPDPSSWDLYCYDMGMVGPGLYFGPTTGLRGLRIADYPGKFGVHTPSLNGDYPTRDGEARYIAFYLLLKRMCVRATSQDFERLIRPWVLAYFAVEKDDAKNAIATEDDIAKADAAAKSLGAGALNTASLPDSIKIEIIRAAMAMQVGDFLSFLNAEISKAILGQSFTTEPGKNGNFAAMDIANKATLRILKYDAATLADTLRRDLAMRWMKLRYPQANRRLCPQIVLHVTELPEPDKIIEIAAKATSIDIPVDVDQIAELANLPIVPNELDEPRRTRMVAAGKSVEPGDDDPNEPGSSPEDPEPTKTPNDKKNGAQKKPPAEA